MSKASRSAGSCATAAATPSFASAAMLSRRTDIASWYWLRQSRVPPRRSNARRVQRAFVCVPNQHEKELVMNRAYNVIDADGHILEPLDLWDRYMDPKFRDGAPRLVKGEDGKDRLVVE